MFITGNESFNKNTALNNTEKMTKSVQIFIYEPKKGAVYMVFICKT